MPIRVLDAVTISKIAAGEVVERPASVLKELVENALDAGARHITAELRAGGIDYLRVTDDGCGIAPEQVRMAFENHATSKLREVKDLVEVSTMGFRGEALPSIAAVSRVEMTTRARGQDTGTRIALEGGKVLSVDPAGCPDGTTVQMRELFFNLPARRAFLKRPAAEAGACADTLMRLALGNPGVAFRLLSNGKQVFRTQGDGVLRHAIMAVYDRQTAENMQEVSGAVGALSVSGLIGVGSCAKASRSHQHFFVNGRAIRCPMLSQALEQACRGRVLIGRYPMCALALELPPSAVDVNVHPGKLEVRFRDESALFTAAGVLMAQAFERENMLTPEQPATEAARPAIFIAEPAAPEQPASEQTPPEQSATGQPTPEPPSSEPPSPEQPGQAHAAPDAGAQPAAVDKSEPAPEPIADMARLGVVHIPLARPVTDNASGGSAHNAHTSAQQSGETKRAQPAYAQPGGGKRLNEALLALRAEEAEPLAAVDKSQPHPAPQPPLTLMDAAGIASDARSDAPEWHIVGTAFSTYILVQAGDTLYAIDQHAAHERILYEKFMRQWESGVASQVLLVPYTVSVSAAEKAQIMENRELLSEVGFEIEDFGDRDIQVRAVPQIMGEPDLRPFFLMSAAELKRLRSAPLAARRDAVMQAACKHAVKGGDALSMAEIEALLEQMRKTGAPPNCPHGRPVIIAIPRTELEKRFSRIV